MGTKILSLLLFIALPGAVLAGESKLISLSGTVDVRPTRLGQWGSASENMEIAEGGGIRTGANSGAIVIMPNKTKVWMKENSSLEIEQRQTLASRLALVFGRIKVRVPHLMRKERFEVRTPAAVCAVRGTEFTMGTNEEGKMDVQVLFGEVKLKFVIPPERGSDEFNIPQGQGLHLQEEGKAVKPALLTAKAEREALENWNPGLKPEDRQKDLKQKENDRAQVKEFARVTNNSENTVKSFLNVVKDSDLEAGRTLTDVHGNLVRVDQRMMRPSPDEIQFFNLVKRPVYSNNGSSLADGGFKYNGAAAVTDRLDYMQMTMAFNKDLPQNIAQWPSFFNDNSINPSWASFVLANRTDPSQIFFIAEGFKYDPTPGREMLVNNPWVLQPAGSGPLAASDTNDRDVIMTGILKDDTGANGISAINGLNRITNLQVLDAGSGSLVYSNPDHTAMSTPITVGGTGGDVVWAIKTDGVSSYSSSDNRPDNAPIVQYQAEMYDIGNQQSTNLNEYIWFAKENYVIGNGGQIKTASDFTNSSTDPFTLLNNSAFESVMYIKKSIHNDPAWVNGGVQPALLAPDAKSDISADDYFAYGGGAQGIGTNIDMVFIPDLLVAAIQNMLPAITNLKN